MKIPATRRYDVLLVPEGAERPPGATWVGTVEVDVAAAEPDKPWTGPGLVGPAGSFALGRPVPRISQDWTNPE